MKASKPRQQNGFSLLEILVAFSIMALSLSILLRIFSGGVNTAAIAEDYTAAVQIAETLMAKIGSEIPLKPKRDQGVEDDKYHWELVISPYTLTNQEAGANPAPVELMKVNVSVYWGDGDSDDREIRLNTLKLAAKENALQSTPLP